MSRGNETLGKKDVRAKKEKRRQEKEKKREERKNQSRDGKSFDDMIAYVDEFGRITATPPDPANKVETNIDEIQIAVPKSVPGEEDNIHHGIVTFFNNSKGFGFIKDTDTQRDVFVHINELMEPVKENNKVLFEIQKGPKGLTAVNVKLDKE